MLNQPFLESAGPADFGSVFIDVDNVTMKKGGLGLSSHHWIHSNGAFSTGGTIQMTQYSLIATFDSDPMLFGLLRQWIMTVC